MSTNMDRSRTSSATGSIATRRAYMAHAHRRRPPPRFRPYMIIILVLAVGLLLIGLTMTIIGLWPSYSPSGGNPLKIVGPIMLGMGLLGIIGSIANICYTREKEKEAIMKSISDMRSSRLTLASHHSQQMTPTPSLHARPSKGILKAPSTSTYNGTMKGSTGDYESDSGMANTHSFSTNRSYERDSDASDTSRNLDNIKVEMMPDPTAYRHGKPVDQSSTGSDQGVPPASMRGAYRQGQHRPQQQQQKQARPSKPTYSNQAYSPDARETDIDGDLSASRRGRQMQAYSYDGYDAYDAANTSGGSLTGGGVLTGGGALGSPYASPQPAPAQPAPQQAGGRTRWGSKSPRSSSGQTNAAYSQEQSVSVVSETYQQATQGYSTPSSEQARHYTSYAHSGGAPTTPHNTSSSTEV